MNNKQVLNLSVADKLEVIATCHNFSDTPEAADKAQELLKNEADGIADLVSILKPNALKDEEAISVISEATDTDRQLIKDIADTKVTTDEKGDEAGMSLEEKQELFSSVWNDVKSTYVADSFNKYGFLSLFSENTLKGFSDANEDTAEAVQVVKYVDPEIIEQKPAEKVASIIAEATDGDKEILETVVEAVKEAVNFANVKNVVLFADTIASLGKDAAAIGTENTAQVLSALANVAESEKARIASGENISVRAPMVQGPNEMVPTETDTIAVGKLPSNIGNLIVEQANGGINMGVPVAPAATATQTNPMVAFSNSNNGMTYPTSVQGMAQMLNDEKATGYMQANFSNQSGQNLVNFSADEEVNCMKEYGDLLNSMN